MRATDLGYPNPEVGNFFLPKIQLNDPKSIARKNALRAMFPKSTCRFLHPDFGKKKILNPRVVVGYCLSEGAEIRTLTSSLPHNTLIRI